MATMKPSKNAVVSTQAKPNTVILQGVALPDVKAATTYAAVTTHSSTFQTGQTLNRIGDI